MAAVGALGGAGGAGAAAFLGCNRDDAHHFHSSDPLGFVLMS